MAYEEAAAHCDRALQALDFAAAPEETERCELLLALGEAQYRSGEGEASQAAFRRAAEIAGRLGLSEPLARAALGFAGPLGDPRHRRRGARPPARGGPRGARRRRQPAARAPAEPPRQRVRLDGAARAESRLRARGGGGGAAAGGSGDPGARPRRPAPMRCRVRTISKSSGPSRRRRCASPRPRGTARRSSTTPGTSSTTCGRPGISRQRTA